MKHVMSQISLGFAALVLGLAFVVPAAHAGLLLEPYAGYGTGTTAATVGSTTTNNNVTGLTYGGRVGYESPLGFMVGADLLRGSWSDNATPSNTIAPSDVGIFVGYNFPVLIRIWGEYGFNSQLKYTYTGGSNTFTGNDIKLGVGFKVMPMLSLNVEYIMGTYSKNSDNLTNVSLTDKVLLLGVSLPFNLL